MTTIEEILRRRMRLPAPKKRIPVTPGHLSGLAVPFLWALVYPADRMAVLFLMKGVWLYELLSFVTALAICVALVFSPRDEVVPWETVPEPRQRFFFFLACGVSLGGVLLLGMSGGGFWAYLYLALAVLTLLWLALPYLALSGNAGALRLLLFSMRMGMVWFSSVFFILAIRDGTDTIMNGTLPPGALGFLGVTYWWFLMSARHLLSDEAGEWPVFFPGWQRRYWSGLALSGCLALLWILTGFTHDGNARYGEASYSMAFPFYDVAAWLEPFSFSNGPLLLLHSIPWKALFFPGHAVDGSNLLHALSCLHWLGLFCLAVAVLTAFGAFFAGMWPRLTFAGAVFACLASAATAFRTAAVWREFVSRPGEGAGGLPGGMDHFMLAGQHVPVLFFSLAAFCLGVFLAVTTAGRCLRRQEANGR